MEATDRWHLGSFLWPCCTGTVLFTVDRELGFVLKICEYLDIGCCRRGGGEGEHAVYKLQRRETT